MSEPHERLGVQAREGDSGLEVAVVEDESLADRLGIEVGDVLRSINGQAIRSASDVASAIAEDTTNLEVEVVRGGANVTLSLKRREHRP